MAVSVMMMMMMIVAGFVMAMSMVVMFVAMSVIGVVTIYRNKNRTKQNKCKKFYTHFAPLPPKQLSLTDSLRKFAGVFGPWYFMSAGWRGKHAH